MARFVRDEKEELLDRRASLFSGLQVIVCDTETTGLNTTTSRIVSLALTVIQQGRPLGSHAELIDPGLEQIGASHIHHITTDVLRQANARTFADAASDILRRFTPIGDATVVLAGFNVIFDALLLHHELTRIGSQLPDVSLLDVRTLAQHAGVAGSSLAVLAKSLGIAAHDAHSAIGDTNVTTEALLRLADKLHAADPTFRLESMLDPFDPTMRLSRTGIRSGKVKQEEPFAPEHAAAHQIDLTDKVLGPRALAVCISENCAQLVSRCQDGVTDHAQAQRIAAWLRAQLDRTDITRVTRGRLLGALAAVAGSTNDPAGIRRLFTWVEARLPAWGPCTPADLCDRCADDRGRACRFRAVRYELIAAFLYDDNELSVARAEEFLPYPGDASSGPGRPPRGWFGQLARKGHLDAAGYGAHLVAQAGPRSRTRGYERVVLAFAWDQGSRNAHLAERYANRILADGSPDPARPHLVLAEQVCAAALASRAGSKEHVLERLTTQLARIRARKASPPRTPPAHTRNGRPPRPNPLRPS